MAEVFSHPIPAVLILLGVLITVHETGHFLVGRWCGIAVETFSIGFGPKIFGFRRKGTDYRLSWIPLGGYVKFAGAHPSEEISSDMDGIGFLQASRGKRALAIAAGPLANFLLAVVVFMVLGMAGIPHPPAIVGKVIDGSAAERAGVEDGDKVVEIAGEPVEDWRDLERLISGSPGKTLSIVVDRDGERKSFSVIPEAVTVKNILGKEQTIGRAGVALGRLPAIVTVTSADSPAHLSQLKTGDLVLNARSSASEEWVSIGHYPALERYVKKAITAGISELQFQVCTAPMPGETPGDSGLLPPERTVTVAVPTGTRPESWEAALGIEDAHMTVAFAKEALASIFQSGDVIVGWEGEPVRNIYHLQEILQSNTKPEVKLAISRGFKTTEVPLLLHPVETQKPEGKVTIYTLPVVFWGQPVDPDPVMEQYTNPVSALWFGLKETTVQSGALVVTLGKLITGEFPLKALGGPMLIAKVAGDSAKHGWQTFLGAMALISINLAIINLFPIPVLDGGQLILIGSEAIKGRPLRESAVENFQKVGFAMILALVVLATYNDLSRFWKSMLESVVGLFQ